jgi:MFS family permease
LNENSKKGIDPSVLRVLFAQSFYYLSTSIITNPVLPLFARSIGASFAELGIMSMFRYLGFCFFEPTWGMLSDRIGRKRIIVISIAIGTFVTLSFTFFRDIRWLYFVSFVEAVCSAGYIAPSRALIADITPREKRGKGYGGFLAVQTLFRMPGPFIGGYLAYNYNYYAAFYASAAFMFVGMIFVMHYFPKDKASEGNAAKPTKPNYRSVLNPRTLVFIASRALPFFFTFYSQTILTVVLKESPKFRATEETIGIMATTISGVTALIQYLAGLILDKIGSVKLIIIGFALDGIGYFGYLIADNLAQIWLIRLIVSSFTPFYNVGMMVAIMEFVSKENYGLAMGLYGLSEDIGGILGSSILGAMYDQFGFATCTYFMVSICFLAVLLTWINMRGRVQSPSSKVAETERNRES